MRPYRALILSLCGAVLGAALAGAIPTEPQPETAISPLRQLKVPRPDLSAMQRAVREQMERLQDTVESLQARESATADEISKGFGLLGQAYHAFELFDAAEVCYDHALTASPDEFQWLYYRGLVRNTKGDLEKAVADYQRAGDQKPEIVAIQIRLGNALLELGLADAASRHFNRALEYEPENAAALAGLGRAAYALDDNPRAIELLEKAIAKQPTAGTVHYALGQAYRRQGDMDKARRHLDQQNKQDVKFPDEMAFQLSMIKMSSAFEVMLDLARQREGFSEEDFLGFALAQFGDVPGMSDQFLQVMGQIEKAGKAGALERGRLHYAIGGLLVGENKDEAAIEQFQRAIALVPDLIDARLKLGNALARQSRYDEATAQYNQILRRKSDHRRALAQRSATRGNLGDLAAARADLERLVELEPNDREPRLRLASVLERQGEVDAALRRLGETLPIAETPQEKADGLVAMGDLYQRYGDSRSAVDVYQKAIAIDPEHRPALFQLAGLLGQLGHYPEAARVYTRLVELDASSVGARVGEATSLILAGEHKKARERLEEGLRMLPQSLDLKDILARHLAAAADPTVRDGKRALTLALELYEVLRTRESIETLAMAYAETGQFSEAVEWQKKLLAGSEAETDATARQRWEANLALYERGERCCAGAS